jgi:NADPH:quinone reductase-like Zn-dependent oxidoreductase
MRKKSMRAIQFQHFGGPEVLQLASVDRPQPGPKECLVRVHAAGVNPLEYKIRGGKMRWIMPIRRPYIPGMELCGRIEGCGEEAGHLEIGSWIIGKLDPRRGGAYAEWAVLPEDSLIAKPTSLSPAEGAALPVGGLTALQGLRDRGKMRPGQRILINGASGGVGHLAVQIAAAIGSEVTAVCGPDNLHWVRQLGAHRVLNYRATDFTTEGIPYDLIFDAVASLSFASCARALVRGGVYVTTLPSPGLLLSLASSKKGRMVVAKAKASDLAFLYDLVERGQLRPRIQQVFPLSEARAAQELSASARVAGKLVLQMDHSGAASEPTEKLAKK